jgi:signal peptidase I
MEEYDNIDYNHDYSHKSRFQKAGEFVWEMFKVVVICLMIILPVRYFLIQPFYVKGASMEPNFYDNEYLIIDEITYRFSEPNRGDIVVFKYPNNPKQYFIKRVVGLPGERVKIENSQVYIGKDSDGMEPLREDYLPGDIETNLPLRGYSNVVLEENEYFLLGDNRDQSLDSRVFGPVDRGFIIGRTWLRGWPISRLTVFNTPDYDL